MRSLLIALDRGARSDATIHLATRLAAALGSELLAVAPTGLPEFAPGPWSASRIEDEATAAGDQARHRAGARVEHIRSCCRAAGLELAEASVHEGDTTSVVLRHSQCADLTLIAQADPGCVTHRQHQHFVEQVVLHNARPTLVVPHAWCGRSVGDSILVAWDDSHGAARAASDALPLLRRARQVHLRAWHRAGEDGAQALQARLRTVCRWLARQGVAAEVRVETPHGGIGDAILSAAAELGADLIVMGSYGHSRWTERVVGGATRTALMRSTVPLLMSH